MIEMQEIKDFIGYLNSNGILVLNESFDLAFYYSEFKKDTPLEKVRISLIELPDKVKILETEIFRLQTEKEERQVYLNYAEKKYYKQLDEEEKLAEKKLYTIKTKEDKVSDLIKSNQDCIDAITTIDKIGNSIKEKIIEVDFLKSKFKSAIALSRLMESD